MMNGMENGMMDVIVSGVRIKIKTGSRVRVGRSGYVFSMDALFAIIIATAIIGMTFFMFSNAQKDYFRELQMGQMANDVLIVLDKEGVIETHNKSAIKYGLGNYLPPNYGARLRVFPYECSDPACSSFVESGETPPYEIIKGYQFPVDVMLIIDKSSSMADDCPWWAWWCTGGIGDSKQAAKSFLDYLYFEKDRAGVVSFGNDATLDQALTSDKDLLTAAIDNIDASYWPIQQTAMGDGIDLANQELENNGRPEAKWIHILLSDGKSNRGQDPLDAAQDAADENITIYTIGLGSDADEDTMQQIADMTGGNYYFSPSGDDLQGIYSAIAREIFKISYEVVTARRGFLTIEDGSTKYYSEAELGVWLI